MRILIVHNLLWAHYKASVFQALAQLIQQQPDTQLNVIQIARNERSRADLEKTASPDTPTYSYPYTLLFDRFLEDTTVTERARALLREARRFRPDVVNLTGYYDPAQLLLLGWCKLHEVQVIMQNESTAADHDRGGWKETFKRRIFALCDGFFCFGTRSAEYLRQLGVPAEKILLRKNAVDNRALQTAFERALPRRDAEQQRLGLRPNNFVFVGRLIEFKNLPALLTAFADARTRSANAADWGILLLGDGPERAALRKQADDLGLGDALQFLPGRPWYEVPDVLALSDVFVLPSRSEPWGLVVNEALACGLPVIVSDRCGCAIDLVQPGQNGFVFNPDQPEQLTERLLQFIDRIVDRTAMRDAALRSIDAFSPEAVAHGMLAGFRRLTDN